MIEKLLADIENICQNTPLIRSDKKRKESIYRQCKEKCKLYAEYAEKERDEECKKLEGTLPFSAIESMKKTPSNNMIMVHLLTHCISWTDFTASLSSNEYADMILMACRMAVKSEEKHNDNR